MPCCRWLCLLAVATMLGNGGAWANDSTAELGLGGLVLTHNADISLDREDLTLSRERVRVQYQFTNHADHDIDTLVAFPLPDQTFGMEVPVVDLPAQLDFTTTVDGQPVPFEVRLKATHKGQDISRRLTDLGLPLVPMPERFNPAVNRLSPAQRQALIAEDLIVEDGYDSRQTLWAAQWTLSVTVTRHQRFPAGRTIQVNHSYVPVLGGAVGGGLDPSNRRSPFFLEWQKRFCFDAAFLAGLDRRLQERRRSPISGGYDELWLSYVLTSGGNWANGIGEFRLVVDKGNPASLVSFCGEGVRKIDDRRFEIHRRNFHPTRDFDVLILDFPAGE